MHAVSRRLFLLTLALLLIVSFFPRQPGAASIRRPVWAGRFYEADPAELKKNIDQLTHKAQDSRIQIPADKQLRALIMPHAGCVYSGLTAAHASLVLSRDRFSKVILLGPNHRIVGLSHAAICSATAYETPLGKVNLHPDAAKLLLHYSNSGDTAGDRSRVVGYAAIAFFGDLPKYGKER